MEIVFVILVLVALFIIVSSKEGFMETSYYYGAAPGARGERMVCMPEDESVSGLGVSVGNIVGSNSCAPPMPSVCQQYAADPKAQIINYPAAQFNPVDISGYDLPPAMYAAVVDPTRPAGNQAVGLSLGKTGIAYRRIGNRGVFPFVKIGGKWIPVKKSGEGQWVVDETSAGATNCAARAQQECVGTRGKDREACLRASKAACDGGVSTRPSWSSTLSNVAKPSAATCTARAQKECAALRGKEREKCLKDAKKRCVAGKPPGKPKKPTKPSAATCTARAQKECKAIRGLGHVDCLKDSKKRCAAGKPPAKPKKPIKKKPSAKTCASRAQKECNPLRGSFRDKCLKDSKKRCAAGKPALKTVNANVWCAAAAKTACKSKKDKKARDKCTKDAKKKCTGK